MRNTLTKLALGSSLFLLGSSLAFADDHHIPSTALPLTTILDSLEKQGFKSIQKIEYENGSYEVKAVNSDGMKVKFQINPTTGTPIPSEKELTEEKISMKEAIKIVETAGYRDIYEVKLEKHTYEIEAFDKEGHKVEFKVDAATGKMTKDWF